VKYGDVVDAQSGERVRSATPFELLSSLLRRGTGSGSYVDLLTGRRVQVIGESQGAREEAEVWLREHDHRLLADARARAAADRLLQLVADGRPASDSEVVGALNDLAQSVAGERGAREGKAEPEAVVRVLRLAGLFASKPRRAPGSTLPVRTTGFSVSLDASGSVRVVVLSGPGESGLAPALLDAYEEVLTRASYRVVRDGASLLVTRD
jgi:hypothetical protein